MRCRGVEVDLGDLRPPCRDLARIVALDLGREDTGHPLQSTRALPVLAGGLPRPVHVVGTFAHHLVDLEE